MKGQKAKDDRDTPVLAETSYGSQKQIIELYAYDYGRKGYLETRAVRLPTVAIRSGAVSGGYDHDDILEVSHLLYGKSVFPDMVVEVAGIAKEEKEAPEEESGSEADHPALHRSILLHLRPHPRTPLWPTIRMPHRRQRRRPHHGQSPRLPLEDQDCRKEHCLCAVSGRGEGQGEEE